MLYIPTEISATFMPTTPFKFDRDKVLAKLEEYRDYMNGFVGKPGHNPFMFLYNTLDPLLTRIEKGEETEELFNSVMNLIFAPPIVGKVVEQQVEPVQVIGGIKFPTPKNPNK